MSRTAAATVILTLALVAGACSPADDAASDSVADTAAPGIGAAAGDTTAVATPTGLLDPNTATREQLAALPGMTPELADTLLARRPFNDMLAVDAILAGSLSEQQRDSVYVVMFRPIALNTASPQEIELIPGVGPRMRHEFEEYRPYADMARFRREIGKYVDSTEVARLEQYVRVE